MPETVRRPDGDLRDRVALVIGAAGGVGDAAAQALAQAGAAVALADIDAPRLERLFARMTGEGWPVTMVPVDVTDRTTVKEAVAKALAWRGRLDVVLYTAGYGSRRRILDIDDAFWDHIFDVNLRGVLFTCQAVLPTMAAQRYGRIVVVSSLLATFAKKERAAYAAAKAGVNAFVRDLALEAAADGITANIVSPGPIDTPMLHSVESDIAQRGREIPLGRVLMPEEVAAAILYLVSPGAAMVTGHNLHINGGQFMA